MITIRKQLVVPVVLLFIPVFASAQIFFPNNGQNIFNQGGNPPSQKANFSGTYTIQYKCTASTDTSTGEIHPKTNPFYVYMTFNNHRIYTSDGQGRPTSQGNDDVGFYYFDASTGSYKYVIWSKLQSWMPNMGTIYLSADFSRIDWAMGESIAHYFRVQ